MTQLVPFEEFGTEGIRPKSWDLCPLSSDGTSCQSGTGMSVCSYFSGFTEAHVFCEAPAKLTAASLLLHLLRQGADLSIEGNDLVIGGSDSARFMPLIEGRAYELITLLQGRADWLADLGLREPQS